MTGKPPPGSPPTRRATLRDVARAAGVSVWTASNAYSHPDRVASATRERVLATAASVGYAGPDPIARSLATGRTRIVALLADGTAESLLSDPAAALVARGLVRACDRAGVSLLLSGATGPAAVDGAVLFRTLPAAPAPHPVVVVDVPPTEGVVVLRADVAGAAAAAARHLRELGHDDLVVLAWPGCGERLDGVRAGWGDAGPLTIYMAGAPEGHHAREAGPAAGRRAVGPTRADAEIAARVALGRTPRPRAVLGLNDLLARVALDTARWTGRDVPGDLSIVGIDDLPGSDALGLTGVFVPYRPLGELAGAALSALVDGATPEPSPPLPTSLVIRGTTGPPRG